MQALALALLLPLLLLLLLRARGWVAPGPSGLWRRLRFAGQEDARRLPPPDLGIGGAERLVVDAAVALQKRGHSVVLHTAHHDTSRCFVETRDGTLAVRVAGDWLPRTLCGRLHIVCATLRALWLGSGLGC